MLGSASKLLLVRNRNCIQDSMKLSIYSKIITSDGKHIFIGKVTGWTTNKRVLECQKLYEWQTEMVYAWPEGSRIYLQDKKGLCVMNSTMKENMYWITICIDGVCGYGRGGAWWW